MKKKNKVKIALYRRLSRQKQTQLKKKKMIIIGKINLKRLFFFLKKQFQTENHQISIEILEVDALPFLSFKTLRPFIIHNMSYIYKKITNSDDKQKFF